ncbi:uncharacterized protein TNIN_62581 [Trichonephila inaurata madagascariensis]|uniref:Uncharacterized protein n=1 Tax=Trichonephila inaurata madagascariensis TaxID=2747483 RepID=A0A8X6XFX6_9ARAC|nr:uncharacterized protein TNIN_62581 [Trichonephila inaurata madagascariensis]
MSFTNNQTEFQKTEDDGLFRERYCSQNTALQYIQQPEGNFANPQIYNASGHETPLRWKNNFQADQINSIFEYKYSTGGNTEQREIRLQDNSVDISFDSRRMTTACDSLLGMDSLNNDFLSQTIDSMLLDISPADFNFLDSHGEMSVLNDDILASIFGSTNESNCENVELSNNLFKDDSSAESLKSSCCYINSNTLIEDYNFQIQANSGFKASYHCESCLNKFNSKDTRFSNTRKCILAITDSSVTYMNGIFHKM